MTENTATVLYEKDGHIARLTLNRPENLNAINETMPDELSAAVARANEDDEAHVIILSGAGRAFCSGYDLEIFAERPRSAARFGSRRRCRRGYRKLADVVPGRHARWSH